MRSKDKILKNIGYCIEHRVIPVWLCSMIWLMSIPMLHVFWGWSLLSTFLGFMAVYAGSVLLNIVIKLARPRVFFDKIFAINNGISELEPCLDDVWSDLSWIELLNIQVKLFYLGSDEINVEKLPEGGLPINANLNGKEHKAIRSKQVKRYLFLHLQLIGQWLSPMRWFGYVGAQLKALFTTNPLDHVRCSYAFGTFPLRLLTAVSIVVGVIVPSICVSSAFVLICAMWRNRYLNTLSIPMPTSRRCAALVVRDCTHELRDRFAKRFPGLTSEVNGETSIDSAKFSALHSCQKFAFRSQAFFESLKGLDPENKMEYLRLENHDFML